MNLSLSFDSLCSFACWSYTEFLEKNLV
jgi:hypothetical protein